MLRTNRFPVGFFARIVLLAVGLLGCAAPALAEPRLVRIIWDVGRHAGYYKVFPRAIPGHDAFTVPANAAAASNELFIKDTGTDILRKGDRVRLYVVNYNSVSHVWHESSVVEQVAEAPSLVGPLLNALTLAITGAPTPPSTGLNMFALRNPPVVAVPPACPLADVRSKLDLLRKAAGDLGVAAEKLVTDANAAGLAAAAAKLAAAPTNQLLWHQFDNRLAWLDILTNVEVFGANFADKYRPIGDQIDPVQRNIDDANSALLGFDRAVAMVPTLSETCVEIAKVLVWQRDNIVSFVREVAGDGSPLRDTLTRFQTAGTMWSLYKRKLETTNWTDEAIELIVKEPIQAEAVLRVDGVFASPEKTVTERTQRSVVLGVLTHVPILVISSGVGYNDFNFKKLHVVKATTTAADGTVSAKDRLETTDDTAWQRIVPVWIQSVRVLDLPKAGIYGTFGTTPDRNAFQNAIVGASVFVPRWRTVFTGGVIMARAYEQDELDPVIAQFSDSAGFAFADVSATNVPLPKTPFHKSFYWSVTFGLVSF